MCLNFGKQILEKISKNNINSMELKHISEMCFFLQILGDWPDVCSICETFKSIRTCFVHSAFRHVNWIASLI
jgi:hypothetical protein